MKKAFKKNRVKIAAINEKIEDNLSGIRVVKSFANEELENEKFQIGNQEFLEAKKIMEQKMGDWKIMALASCEDNYPMVRNVSCLFYNDKIYFKTDKNFRKTQQLFKNNASAYA
mgnify:FL=1